VCVSAQTASIQEFIVPYTVGDIHSKGVPVGLHHVAEARDQRLLGDRFTAYTAHEAFARVQHIRRLGFQVKITGPDGESVHLGHWKGIK
jgi:hypothetical protein